MINFLDSTNNLTSKYRTKTWLERSDYTKH